MKVLVLGSGGREHALVWKIKRSPLVETVFCSPGNAGIALECKCLGGDAVEIAHQVGADLVVVGPDGLLADGVVDRLNAAGFLAFGPTQAAAKLESSKIWTKTLLQKYKIPTAQFAAFDSARDAKTFLANQAEGAFVVKADGLAVGKGVVMANSKAEAMAGVDEVLGIASQTVRGDAGRILVEEKMSGPEVSFFALCDGQSLLPLVEVQDHKRAFDGDLGPNTGGMGAYSPVPFWNEELRGQVIETILQPTLEALQSEGVDFRGVLYCGLMLTEEGPKVIEYNARFGDPECQIMMTLLDCDIVPALLACARGEGLSDIELRWKREAALVVVMAAHGYPAMPRRDDPIIGLVEVEEALVFHAGTRLQSGQTVTSGGRVLGVVGTGSDFETARTRAYKAVSQIHFEGAHSRSDIGHAAMGEAGDVPAKVAGDC